MNFEDLLLRYSALRLWMILRPERARGRRADAGGTWACRVTADNDSRCVAAFHPRCGAGLDSFPAAAVAKQPAIYGFAGRCRGIGGALVPYFRDFDAAGFLAMPVRSGRCDPQPWQHWTNPLDPYLAGLPAQKGSGIPARPPDRAPGGSEEGLPPTRFLTWAAAWTLLVQAVDHHVPSVAALLDPFRFIPNWRRRCDGELCCRRRRGRGALRPMMSSRSGTRRRAGGSADVRRCYPSAPMTICASWPN